MMRFTKPILISAGFATALTLGSVSVAAAAPDFTNANHAATSFLRLRCTLDPHGQVFASWSGTVYAQVPGKKLKPLMGVTGYNVCRTVHKADGSYQMLSREVMYYRDLKSGKILTHWKNPFTGQTDQVMPVHNDPVNNTMPAPGPSSHAMPWKIRGDTAMLLVDVPLSYPNPLSPSRYPQASGGKQYIASEHFGFFASVKDMENISLKSVPSVYSWFRTGPWLPWMKMGKHSGGLIYSAQGKKLAHGFSQLPRQVRNYTRKHFPKFMHAPKHYVKPNATTWTVYKAMHPPKHSADSISR